MPLSVILRRLLLITLLALTQSYWLHKIWSAVGRRRRPGVRFGARILILLVVLAMIAVLYDRISFKFLPSRLSCWIAPAVQLWIFFSTLAFFLTKTLHALVWCASRMIKLFRGPQHDESRRHALRQLASFAGGTPFLIAAYGYSFERLDFHRESVEVPIPNLPPALDGLRIVQLSDIHAGDFMSPREIRRAVDMANDLSPHLAVVTGDLITSRGDPLEPCIHELARLRAPLGTWGCNGNHEIYAGAENQAELLFGESGMRLLRCAASEVAWKTGAMNLIGIDYQRVPFNGRSIPTLNGAEILVRHDIPNILLSHNPNTFFRAAAAGIELSMAGHTHGGQVNLEILHPGLNPARFVTQFVAGLYQLSVPANGIGVAHRAYLYVNRGLGTLAFPARFGSPPEISLLTLRTAPAH